MRSWNCLLACACICWGGMPLVAHVADMCSCCCCCNRLSTYTPGGANLHGQSFCMAASKGNSSHAPNMCSYCCFCPCVFITLQVGPVHRGGAAVRTSALHPQQHPGRGPPRCRHHSTPAGPLPQPAGPPCRGLGILQAGPVGAAAAAAIISRRQQQWRRQQIAGGSGGVTLGRCAVLGTAGL